MAAAPQIAQITPIRLRIEAGFPLPKGRGRGVPAGPVLLALRELASSPIGSSFFVPHSVASRRQSISVPAIRVGGPGWATVRSCDGGFRVWKIAEPKLR